MRGQSPHLTVVACGEQCLHWQWLDSRTRIAGYCHKHQKRCEPQLDLGPQETMERSPVVETLREKTRTCSGTDLMQGRFSLEAKNTNTCTVTGNILMILAN